MRAWVCWMVRSVPQRLVAGQTSAVCRQHAPVLALAARASGTSSKGETYTEKMAKTGRPVSPHVEIYAFPIVALSSITTRITGVALTVGRCPAVRGLSSRGGP